MARLAKVRLAQHEPTESAKVAVEAVDLAAGLTSSVVVEWLINVYASLASRYPDVADVAQLADRMRAYLRTAAPEREHEVVAN